MNKMLLIEKLLNEAKWRKKDTFPSSSAWKTFANECLEFINEKGEIKRFWPRLISSKTNQRDEAFAEIYAAFFMEKELGCKLLDWEVKTLNGRDVEFTVLDKKGTIIYCEVKSPGWEGELDRSTKENADEANKRSKQEKYINGECFFFATHIEIRKTLQKAYPKYLPDKRNLLIIVDDFQVSPLQTPVEIEIALYIKDDIYKDEAGYFTNSKYSLLGGVLFIKPVPRDDIAVQFESRYCENKNAQIPLIIDL